MSQVNQRREILLSRLCSETWRVFNYTLSGSVEEEARKLLAVDHDANRSSPRSTNQLMGRGHAPVSAAVGARELHQFFDWANFFDRAKRLLVLHVLPAECRRRHLSCSSTARQVVYVGSATDQSQQVVYVGSATDQSRQVVYVGSATDQSTERKFRDTGAVSRWVF